IVPVLLGRDRWRSSYWKLLGAIAISEVVTSVILNTYWLMIITGKTAFALLPLRGLNAAVMIPVMASITFALRQGVLRFMP
ncbi:MAG TPA: hypothetical protein DDZ53_07420, partial [Firmicutes bacterium]|nr:hypothetical protein [Bacillota bacterium]